jgi:hypothetical protein
MREIKQEENRGGRLYHAIIIILTERWCILAVLEVWRKAKIHTSTRMKEVMSWRMVADHTVCGVMERLAPGRQSRSFIGWSFDSGRYSPQAPELCSY